jgi:hypothetical protein
MKANSNLGRRFKGPLNPKNEPLHQGFGELSLKEYCSMQKKHLKAYLNGFSFFTYKGKVYGVEQEFINKDEESKLSNE